MKTISELNKKTWYRLVKVLYIGCLSVTFLFTIILVSLNFQPTRVLDKSHVQCTDGKTLDQDYLSRAGVPSIYSITYDAEAKRKTKFFCLLGTQSDISTLDLLRSDLSEYADNDIYEIVYYVEPRDWPSTLSYSLLSAVILLLGFELTRRVFYYIVLGKFVPEK